MKFSKLSQLILVSSIGLLVATLFSACAITTIDYVFVASSSGIQTFDADASSGALRIGGSTVTTGVNSPVSLAVTPNFDNLYVANAGDKTIVHFDIGLTAGLTQKDTVTLGTTPVSITVNAAGTYLYVVSGTTSATLTSYPLAADGTIGTATSVVLSLPGYTTDTLVPTGVAVLANNAAVYVSLYDQSAYNPNCTLVPPATSCTTSLANPGWIYGFNVASSGALTPATNSPYQAGVKPSALAADPTNRFVYATDYAQNQMIGYTILNTSTLNFMTSGPFRTGDQPSAIAIDPRGLFIYVTNKLDSSVLAYSINLATGTPTSSVNVTGSQVNATDTQPVAVIVDSSLGQFVYTANYLGNSISGFKLNSTSGALTAAQATPYPTGSQPTALVSIPRGNHVVQAVE
jgi:6-phosphogluconolactonase (cycloisomerase 2 family)